MRCIPCLYVCMCVCMHECMHVCICIICGFRSDRGTISKTAPYSNKRAALSPAATWRRRPRKRNWISGFMDLKIHEFLDDLWISPCSHIYCT